MHIQKDIPLSSLNTFGIDASSELFVEISSIEGLQEILGDQNLKNNISLILGGGSNILLTQDVPGLTVKVSIENSSVVQESEDEISIEVGAGSNWHELVLDSVNQGYGGLENLSLIPGNVGASPMQNIGAYGVEVKDLITNVKAVSRETGDVVNFSNSDCNFGYRSSIFKTSAKDEFVITHVTYKLSKRPIINTTYGAIEQALVAANISDPNIKDVSNAVIGIRSSKLPNPKELGNAGSFFKNPVVDQNTKDAILKQHPDAPNYVQSNGDFKMAAGWLIEQCGWKGKQVGNTGAHAQQALVLVNYGNATGSEIYDHSQTILESVQDRFGITLEREVNIL